MLAILFPHLYEDVEFLVPTGAEGEDVDMAADEEEAERGADLADKQPVAGPSRLR